MQLVCAHRVLDLSVRRVMGVLNVTPDSFSDGGCFVGRDAALQHARAMVEAGAVIVDVGGESTRPGAALVTEQEELDRVCPVVEAIASELDVVISVDTSTPVVMRESIRLGAGLINDVRAFQRPGAMAAVQGESVALCVMHMQGEPKTMQHAPAYHSVVDEVLAFLLERVQALLARGVAKERIVIDPGFGFGKQIDHNYQLLDQLNLLVETGYPVLAGISRKSMLGAVVDRPPQQRLAASLAAAVIALERGASIIRAHDVAETADVIKVVNYMQMARHRLARGKP